MDLKILLYVGLIAILTFLVRSLFRLIVGKWGSDVYWHLYCIDEIRKNRHKIPHKLSRTLTSGFFTYPFFVHWILSFLKKNWVERIEPFFGAIVDTLHNSFLFFSSVLILNGSSNSLEVAFLASMIFCFSPMLISDNARTFALSPRVFGSMLFSVSTFLLFQFHWTGNFSYFLISLIIVPFLFLSSKFASQVLVFFYPILALFLKSIWFFLPVPVGVLLALVFTRGLYFRILKTHLRFLIFWRKEIQSRYPTMVHRESFFKVVTALPKLIHQPREYLKVIYVNPIVNTINHNPFLILWGIAFFIGRSYRNLFFDLSIWVIAGILTFSVFSFKYLAFLGEPQRYLEYIIFPLSILSAYAIVNLGLFLLGLLLFIYSLSIIFIDYRSSIRLANQYSYRKFEEVIGYLSSISEPKNILVIPTFYTPQVAYYTHHKVIMFSDNLASSKENEEEFLLVFPNLYDYPNKNLDLLLNKFHLDLIVTRRKIDYNSYDFSRFFACFENEEFSVYEAKDKTGAKVN